MFGGRGLKDDVKRIEGLVTSLESSLNDLRLEHRRLRSQVADFVAGEAADPEAILDGRGFKVIPAEGAGEFMADKPELLVLDVRSPEEWRQGHIPGATNIDVRELESRLEELPKDRNHPVICFCGIGARSAAACELLSQEGYTRIYNVAGGMNRYAGEVVKE